MFLLYAAGIWLTLYAGWLIAARCTASSVGRCGAAMLLALVLATPIAGTSLMLMDPYVTARSFSTPFGLLALASALDFFRELSRGLPPSRKNLLLCVASLLVAAAVHPLMAAYSLGCVLLLTCVSLPQRKARVASTLALCLLSIGVAVLLEWMSPVPVAGYAEVARTRTYWFPQTWHWYEMFGLVGPLAVLAWIASREKGGVQARRALAQMSIAAGVTATVVAAIFARLSSTSYEVARLQPLRVYQTIYIVMLLLIGAAAGELVLKRRALRWTVFAAGIGSLIWFVQTQTFPNSGHVELPWKAPVNGWEQGFQWVRDHTPRDARFALDANYITAAGEDAQNFRAIAERSEVPDYAKDGGLASIAPDLTAAWIEGQSVQTGLNSAVTASVLARLRADGVDWIVVEPTTSTVFPCAFMNGSVKVCRLPQ